MRFNAILTPPRITRDVDDGHVLCPVRLREIDVSRCTDCEFLAATTSSAPEGGRVESIACAPSIHELVRRVSA
jgi:hypothetical protein